MDRVGFPLGITSFCFGTLNDADRTAVEQHLFSCNPCWSEFQRLDAAVKTLRFDRTLQPGLPIRGVVSLLGLSGRIDRAFAGHRGFVLTASAAFAVLFAVPVLVELAYQFDRLRSPRINPSFPGMALALRDFRSGFLG